MPSPPGSRPSRQLTVRLPWSVWARLVALAAADSHGAKPGRVAATALGRGVEVLERAAAMRGGPAVADAPCGQRDGLAGDGAFTPAPNDPRWALDAVGNHYAREPHTIGAMAPDGRRVEVAVVAGDTVAIVGQALAAAWQARGGAVG